MAARVQASRRDFKRVLAWAIFAVALLAWFILRLSLRLGAVCDVLIIIALAAQAWLLFLPKEEHQ